MKMEKQQSIADIEYANRKRKTKRDEFLGIMEEVIPWDEWTALVEPYYPGGKRGRPPRGVETMLRMYLLANWFNLSDEGVEDAIYDSYAFRKFMRVDFLSEEQAPDATNPVQVPETAGRQRNHEAAFRYDTGVSGSARQADARWYHCGRDDH